MIVLQGARVLGRTEVYKYLQLGSLVFSYRESDHYHMLTITVRSGPASEDKIPSYNFHQKGQLVGRNFIDVNKDNITKECVPR